MCLRDHDLDNPLNMSEEDRFDEIADILAGGVLRLRRRVISPFPADENLPESSRTGLELSGECGPDRTTGEHDREPEKGAEI